jgi:acyl CoA:acetate/3-ketoacid CoA transferase alpha subunit
MIIVADVIKTVELAGIADGASLSVGGFGLCGIPGELIAGLLEAGERPGGGLEQLPSG